MLALLKRAAFAAVAISGATALPDDGVARRNAPTAKIPSYVIDYAPLVYLDVNEYYFPSDIATQLDKTFPALNFTRIKDAPSPDSLDNLSGVNDAAGCHFRGFNGCPLYLTTNKEVKYPKFYNGTVPDPKTGKTKGATSAAVIVTDHGDGKVDAFYMYFYAFNLGDVVEGTLLGNHVGDWEHTMLRFKNGKPKTMWFSQHDDGEVYTYKAVHKQNGRPIVYSALGSHANYAVPGKHSRQVSVVTLNDQTSKGALWDPVLNAYFYTFTPDEAASTTNTGEFAAAKAADGSAKANSPTDWLDYYGRWGNKQLPDSDPAQTNFLNLDIAWTWEDGPTGPYDKDLNRKGTCPDGSTPCPTMSALPKVSGNPHPSMTVKGPQQTSAAKSPKGMGGGAGGRSSGVRGRSASAVAWSGALMCGWIGYCSV